MGSQNMVSLDEAILQVFETNEDKFFWPLDNQRDAKAFVKNMHELGLAYYAMSDKIGELEDNLQAWRKGLGRVGIGQRMMDLINNCVGAVIEDDDEDILYNIKQLAKSKKIEKQPPSIEKPVEKVAKAEKQQPPSELTLSPPIDPLSRVPSNTYLDTGSKITPSPTQVHTLVSPMHKATPASPIAASTSKKDLPSTHQHVPIELSSPTKTTMASVQLSPKVESVTKHPPVEVKSLEHAPAQNAAQVKTMPPLDSPQHTSKRLEFSEVKTKSETPPSASSVSRTISNQMEVKPASVERHKPPEIQLSYADDSEDSDGESKSKQKPPNDPEVDEVRRKMDAIKKKVEMLKKQKADQAQAAKETNGHSDPVSPEIINTKQESPNSTPDEDKLEMMKKTLHDRFHKFRDEVVLETGNADDVTLEADGGGDEGMQSACASTSSFQSASPTVSPTVISDHIIQNRSTTSPAKAVSEELSSSSDEDLNVVLENYDSDLDADNYDSDLDYSLHKQVSELGDHILSTKNSLAKCCASGGPAGHIYVFSDTPPSEGGKLRVKIGASRRPERRLSQGRCFNLGLRQVMCLPVQHQVAALKDVCRELQEYQMIGQKGWYEASSKSITRLVTRAVDSYKTDLV